MSFFEENLERYKVGIDGEGVVREWFKKMKYPFMQVDIVFRYNNSWCIGEIKSQEKYKAPPFDGHGLPSWQFEKRLQFQKDTGIPAYLIVYDLEEKCLYIASFDKLLNGKSILTRGKMPRLVFELSSFTRLELT